MTSKTPIIAFGPNPEVYYVGLGMRYYSNGMPPSLQGTINKWPALQMNWMSIEADGAWIAREGYCGGVDFDSQVTSAAVDKFREHPTANYVTFGPQKGTWAAITPGQGWAGSMETEMIAHLREMQASMGPSGTELFDESLTGILFGKGTTMVFMFKGGFSYYTDKEAEGSKVENLLNDYIHRQPPWALEHGSALCQWDVEHYFLKFKDPQKDTVQMYWNLPPLMAASLADLTEKMSAPGEQQDIANHEQAALTLAQNNLNFTRMIANNQNIAMLNASWMRTQDALFPGRRL